MANIPTSQYDFNSIYLLNISGYRVDFESLGPKHRAVLKNGEAVILKGPYSFAATPEVLITEVILMYGDAGFNTYVSGVNVNEVIPKNPPIPRTNTNNIRIIGKVVDKESNLPISNAEVKGNVLEDIEFTQTSTFASKIVEETEGGSYSGNTLPTAVLLDEEYTSEEGFFKFDIGLEGKINIDNTSIKISKNKYFPKTINNLQVTEKITIPQEAFGRGNTIVSESGVLEVEIVNIGKILLSPEVINVGKEELAIKTKIQEQENKLIAQLTKPNIPFETRMCLLFEKQKIRIKQMFIPIILGIIATFGPKVLRSIVNKEINALKDKTCPNKDKILEALKKRNKLVKDLNNLLKIVRRITKILGITNALITGTRVALIAGKAFFSIPTPPGGKALYTPLIEDGLNLARKILEKAGIAVNALTLTAATVGMTIGILLDLLKSLDALIQDCAEEGSISFVELNEEFANFINEESNTQLGIVDPISGKPYPYKGFSFEIKSDNSQNFKYPKRYAVARNIQGIQVLRSESSFASGPEILIEELKFIIDRDNLRAD